MKRLTGLALLIVNLGAIAMLLAPSAGADADLRAVLDRDKWCRYGSLDGQPGHWTEHEVRATIDCALERWPADRATVFYIAERESHFGANAQNATSSACGVFQHIGWAPRLEKFNAQVPRGNAGPSCYNGRSNVMVSVRMMHNSGFGPWAA